MKYHCKSLLGCVAWTHHHHRHQQQHHDEKLTLSRNLQSTRRGTSIPFGQRQALCFLLFLLLPYLSHKPFGVLISKPFASATFSSSSSSSSTTLAGHHKPSIPFGLQLVSLW